MARNKFANIKKAKKVAHAKDLKERANKINVKSNRQKKTELRQAALQQFAETNASANPFSQTVINTNGTTLGGPESHMWA